MIREYTFAYKRYATKFFKHHASSGFFGSMYTSVDIGHKMFCTKIYSGFPSFYSLVQLHASIKSRRARRELDG